MTKARDNIVPAEVNCKVIHKKGYDISDSNFENKDYIKNFCIENFYKFSKCVGIEKIMFLKEAVKLNKKLAYAGMNEKLLKMKIIELGGFKNG